MRQGFRRSSRKHPSFEIWPQDYAPGEYQARLLTQANLLKTRWPAPRSSTLNAPNYSPRYSAVYFLFDGLVDRIDRLRRITGVDKTTPAKAVVRELKAVYLRVDAIEQALRFSEMPQGEVGPSGYSVAYMLAEENSAHGPDGCG